MKEVWSKTNLLALNWFRGKFKKRKKEKKEERRMERVKKSRFGFFFWVHYDEQILHGEFKRQTPII